MATRIPPTVADAAVDAVVDRIDAGTGPGTIKVYTGSQPALATDAATGTLLATVTLADPAFASSSGGAALLDVVPVVSTTVVADGTPGWYRVADSAGVTVYDGAIVGADPVIVGQTFEVTAATFSQPTGA